jgi:ubiquinone/menaquinone biosynthesis C-methylase UbiE
MKIDNKKEFLSSLLNKNVELFQLGDSLFTVLPEVERKSHYDFIAKFYDIVIKNSLFHKIVWKNKFEDYEQFCMDALNSTDGGIVLDAGSGSLVFTAQSYSAYDKRPVILLDRSLGMLKKAEERLLKINGKIPSNIILLQADVFNLPFPAETFSTIISYGMLHVFSETKLFLSSLSNALKVNGKMYFLVLLAQDILGKIYLNFAKATGEIALALDEEEMKKKLIETGFEPKIKAVGNMGYIEIDKKGNVG